MPPHARDRGCDTRKWLSPCPMLDRSTPSEAWIVALWNACAVELSRPIPRVVHSGCERNAQFASTCSDSFTSPAVQLALNVRAEVSGIANCSRLEPLGSALSDSSERLATRPAVRDRPDDAAETDCLCIGFSRGACVPSGAMLSCRGLLPGSRRQFHPGID